MGSRLTGCGNDTLMRKLANSNSLGHFTVEKIYRTLIPLSSAFLLCDNGSEHAMIICKGE